MRYRNLGLTGIKVSPYGLGALMFATPVGNPDPEDSIRIIHRGGRRPFRRCPRPNR